MKTLLATLTLACLATTSHAALIEYDQCCGGSTGGGVPAPPVDFSPRLGRTNDATFTVAGIQPNDGTPQFFLITETTAGEYGVDWEMWQEGLRSPEYLVRHAVDEIPWAWSPDFMLEEIEVEITYRWSDQIPGDRVYRPGWYARGQGTIIPEPATWLLMALGCLAFCLGTRHRA